MKKMTKWEIAVAIENLPGNTPWGVNSMMTITYERFTRSELVERYNNIITDRKIDKPLII